MCVLACFSQVDADQANVILIFADDQGYGDLSCFGSETINTPHIDRLAKEGRKFTNFMVASPVCTPSRAALMTGCYPKRVGMHQHVLFPTSKKGLNPSEHTIADHLKGQGYATACFGKWHLGDQPEFLPLAQGFDRYFGIPYSNDMWPGNGRGHRHTKKPYTPLPIVDQDKAVAFVADALDQTLLSESITDKAVEWIKEQQGSDAQEDMYDHQA